MLGTAGAVPTKRRNHNGYLLRWDGEGVLFDPGEGAQRQLRLAGLAAHDITVICVTHFHGDHCLGVPGIVQRIARDAVEHEVCAVYPAAGEEYWHRLRYATAYQGTDVIRERPVSGEYDEIAFGPFTLTARRLSHSIEAYGYRIAEPDGVTMLPERLAERGISGPAVGALRAAGGPLLAEVSVPRPGQRAAFIMDTRLCDNVYALAEGADLLIIESTFLDSEAALAKEYGHLTAAQAGQVARESGVRRLVLTHFSERYGYEDEQRFRAEAGFEDVIVARDLDRVQVPRRRMGTS